MILNKRGLMHRDSRIFYSSSTLQTIKTIELNIIYNYCIIFRSTSVIKTKVNMQFSGLNKIHSQLTAYTGQSVHAVI